MRPSLRRAALAGALLAASPAGAAEIVAGLGVDGLRGDRHVAAGLEARSGPLWRRGWLELGAGAAFGVDDDFWAGAGPVAIARLAPRWRLEASVMLGSYVEGDGGDDLGTDFPIFRSQVGASYAVAEGWWLGAAVDHKSNARTANVNPGIETVYVTLARRF